MKNVIQRALQCVPPDVEDSFPDVTCMSTPKVKCFLNRLMQFLPRDESYMEIGIHQGGTLIPALAGHPFVDAIAVDNWSQFEAMETGSAKGFFYRNLAKHFSKLPTIRIVDHDVWKFLAAPDLKKPLGMVFYDGDHNPNDQRKLFTAIRPHLAQEALLIVDDYDHPPVKEGSELGIKDQPWKSVDFVYLSGSSGYHNGMGLYHLTK